MKQVFSSTTRAYLAGFIDGDGSIYVRLKSNHDYRFGFQIAPYVVLFQSAKDRKNFEELCSHIGLGYMRERKDGILEYVIQRKDAIRKLLIMVEPYVVMKRSQVEVMLKILKQKEKMKDKKDFIELAKLIDSFRELNYSKKRKVHVLTP